MCDLCDGKGRLESGDACPCTMGMQFSTTGRYRVLVNDVPDYHRGRRWWDAHAIAVVERRPRTRLALQRETRLLSGVWETIAALGEA